MLCRPFFTGFLLLFLRFLLCIPSIFPRNLLSDDCKLFQGRLCICLIHCYLLNTLEEAGGKSCWVCCMNKCTLRFFPPADETLPDSSCFRALILLWLTVSNPRMCICKREYRRNGDPDVSFKGIWKIVSFTLLWVQSIFFFSKISSGQFSVIISFMELMKKYILSKYLMPKIIQNFLKPNQTNIYIYINK